MRSIILLSILSCFSGLIIGQDHSPDPVNAKNVIIMIADGAGIAQITAGMYANNGFTNYERCTHVGFHKQHASDNLITDSAAGATAFACGKKTYNGAIGVDTDTLPCTTLLEIAEKRSYATGLIATSTIVHATPASFIAHVPHRNQYEDIAASFVHSGIDLFIGGGQRFFELRSGDNRNLTEELKAIGYQVGSYFNTSFEDWKPNPLHPAAFYTAVKDPLPVLQGRDYLPASATLAIDFLSQRSEQGFFLMIEGAQIDWGGHAELTEYVISEMIDFDNTVGNVLDFAQRDGNTLVVITGDHECGGFAINYGSTQDSIAGAFTSDYHTAEMVPVFTYGPGSEQFSGIYENTAIFDKIMEIMGWKKRY